jgi:hypothetical protein
MSRGQRVTIVHPTRPARPTSFTLLALYLGAKAVIGFGTAAFELLPGRVPERLSLLTAVFAAVAAEALWKCRPWCVRATAGYFAVAILAPVLGSALTDGLMHGEAVFSIISSSILAAIPVLYVNHRASRIFAPQPARVPVPAPRP